MHRDTAGSRVATRRGVLRVGGSLVAAGALAGCIGGGDEDGMSGDGSTEATTTAETETATETTTETESETATETDESDSENEQGATTPYSVSIEPVGEVEFDAVPETWVANNGSWADMGIALGLEPPEAVWKTDRYHTRYYDEIPDVSVDASEMVALYQDGVDKEVFYELDGDVHVIDPNFLLNRFEGWKQADVDEISENVAPFFGNSIYAQHYPWHDGYRYYTLEEAFEKLAQVFERTDRAEAMLSVREAFQENLESVVPPEGERPAVAVLWGTGDQPEEFYPYVIDEGTSFRHFRDLGVDDALANTEIKDFHSSRGAIDLETLLDIDPEVLMLRAYEDKSREAFQNSVVSFLEDHTVASQLTAVDNGDVYRGGGLYMGPITNMVLTERMAGELYDVDEELFDRQRVADVIDGAI